MYLIYLILGVVFFIAAIFLTVSTTIAIVFIILAIGFFLFGAGKLISEKLGQQSRPEHQIISSEELQRIKEQAKRKVEPIEPENKL